MHTLTRLHLIRGLVLPAMLSAGLLTAATSAQERPAAPSKEQAAKIDAEKAPDALLQLSREFFTQKELPAAAACIEKACRLQPALLTDSTKHSPKVWNDFFFTQRGAIQARALKRDDDAGRIKIAKWLREAGLTTAANDMLSAALAINRTNKEAQALAEQWNLLGGGPVEFDFTLALTQPLLQSSFKDENQDVTIRRGRTLLLVPFVYNPGEGKLLLNKMLLKATSDDGKPCMIKGLMLLEGGQASESDPPGKVPEIKLPTGGEPLWDRLTITRKMDKSGYDVVPFRAPRPTARGTPGYRSPGMLPNTQSTLNGSGYAAFLVEIPQTFKHIRCQYRGCPALEIEAGFIAAVSAPLRELKAQEREAALAGLLLYSASKEGPIAAAAVRKLAAFKAEIQGGTAGRSETALQKIDQALLAAIAGSNRLARQTAFESLVLNVQSPTEASFEQIRSSPRSEAVLALIEQAQLILSQPPPEEENATPRQPYASNDPVMRFVSGLPNSPAPPAVFSALAACLGHGDAKVRQRAIDLLLANATIESVGALAKGPPEIKDALSQQMPKVSNKDLKAAIARLLLPRADASTLSRVLSACSDVPIVIISDDDPVLAALANASSPATLTPLLELLSRSDLSAVASSERFRSILTGLAVGGHKDPAVRTALLKLALGQFKPAYEAPVRRERSQSSQATGFETVLVSLALEGKSESSQAAAEALIAAGRINALREQLHQCPKETRDAFVNATMRNTSIRSKKLWEREALPCLFASQLADAGTAEVPLNALAAMEKGVDPKQRWRLNLGIKQGLEWRQLMQLASGAEVIGQAASDLLVKLAMMPSAVEAEFRNAADWPAREAQLTLLDSQRTGKPAGNFACIVYIDLRAAEPPIDPATGRATAAKLPDRYNLPLVGPVVTIQTDARSIRVTADGRGIDMPSSSGAPQQGTPRTIRINVASLLRPLLNSPDAEKEGLSGKLDMLALNEPRECELKYEQLGSWGGEFLLPEPAQPGEKPYRLTGGKVFFEPLPSK